LIDLKVKGEKGIFGYVKRFLLIMPAVNWFILGYILWIRNDPPAKICFCDYLPNAKQWLDRSNH